MKPFHRPRSFLKSLEEQWDLQMDNTERFQVSYVVWIERKLSKREALCVNLRQRSKTAYVEKKPSIITHSLGY